MIDMKEATIEQLMEELCSREGVSHNYIEAKHDFQMVGSGPVDIIMIQPE